MARISVLGGTGYSGGHIVQEAARRGHDVVSYSRSVPAEPVAGVTYRTGSVLEEELLAGAVADADVVFDALSPRGELQGKLEGVVDRLIELATGHGRRLGVLGGASSLLVAPGGPRLIDTAPPAPELLPEIQSGIDVLETLKGAPEALDWFYVSPAAGFGAWAPGDRTGQYRVSDDVLLVDEDGKSFLSGSDLAIAIVDEIENPRHSRARFHVAY
jgi:putative NADH-flavin reductase